MSDVLKHALEQGRKQERTGWICPRCQKVHAPWVPGCDCHFRVADYKPVTPWVKGAPGTTGNDDLLPKRPGTQKDDE